MTYLFAHNSNSKCSHDENDGKKKQKGQKIDKQEPNSNSESVKGTKPKHLHSDYGSGVSVCMHIATHIIILLKCELRL